LIFTNLKQQLKQKEKSMYKLDPTEARKADNAGGMITEIGKYVGVFTQAVDITAKTGTKGVSFTFKSNDGQKANLSLYTVKSDGSKIMGYQALMAIIACLQLRGIVTAEGQETFWDKVEKKEKQRPATLFPDLANKPIGLLLETEEYAKDDGGVGVKMVLKGVFQAGTELTASEILDKKIKPEQLPRLVQALRHHPLKGTQVARTASASNADDPFGDDFSY
jgi:hypothetical protein